MPIRDQMPDPEQFGRRLKGVVEYLDGQSSSDLPILRDGVLSQHYDRLNRIDFSSDWYFSLSPQWEIKLGSEASHDPMGIERPDLGDSNAFATIGGEVNVENGEFEQYSFSVSLLVQPDTENRSDPDSDDADDPCCWKVPVCEDEPCHWRLARRFHFDIDLGDNNHEPKPISHLQIGGKSQLGTNPRGESLHYCSSPLDKPRIPYPPMDPTLLLHMLITQYPTISSADQETWHDHIISSERLLWDDYHGWLSNTHHRDRENKPFSNMIFNTNNETTAEDLIG